MAAYLNVTKLFGISAPAGAIVRESSQERQVDLVKITGTSGKVECMFPKRYGKITATIRGSGNLAIGSLAAGTMTPGTLLVTSRRRSESQNEALSFEIQSEGFFNRFEEE